MIFDELVMGWSSNLVCCFFKMKFNFFCYFVLLLIKESLDVNCYFCLVLDVVSKVLLVCFIILESELLFENIDVFS